MSGDDERVARLREIIASWKGHKAPKEVQELEAALIAYDQNNDPTSFRAKSQLARSAPPRPFPGGFHGTEMTPGDRFVTPERRSQDFSKLLEKGIVGPTMAMVASPFMGPLARMMIEGTTSVPTILGAAGLGAGSELFEENPTALGALANAAQFAAATRLPISEVLTHVGEAEALPGKKMLQMMYRGRSSLTPVEERAMFMSPSPRYAEEYAKRRAGRIGGSQVVDSYLVDPFAIERRGHNITPGGGGNMQSMIAYPKQGEAEYRGSKEFAKGGLARIAARLGAESAPVKRGVANVIKEKGGNRLTGSVEGALERVKNPWDVVAPGLEADPEVLRSVALNQWIDKPLTRYVKNEMATPEDPLRALAERGVLHITPNVPPGTSSLIVGRRAALGRKPFGEGTTPLAKTWEDLADNAIGSAPASTYQNFGSSNLGEEWVNRLDPTTPFYAPSSHRQNVDNLGFDHLIDELSNAINPESGLPRELLFPADRLSKVSVPQAVERVAKINEWRAAQKVLADQAKANNAATVLHKEYPHSEATPNPAGLKWVELKKSDALPEGWSTYEDPITGQTLPVTPEGRTITGSDADPRYAALRDALKYEGDTMGHCVGGYCNEVAEGRSRIYSLRDAKGQPHVTIEASPQPYEGFDPHGDWDKLPEELQDALMKDYGSGNVGWTAKIKKDPRVVAWETENIPRTPDRIVQIKGKQNRAPNPEYLPFVQDFVKSGQWSDVGDLQNAGLVGVRDRNGALRFISPEESAAIDNEAITGQRFAQGGSVRPNKIETVNDLRAIINAIQ